MTASVKEPAHPNEIMSIVAISPCRAGNRRTVLPKICSVCRRSSSRQIELLHFLAGSARLSICILIRLRAYSRIEFKLFIARSPRRSRDARVALVLLHRWPLDPSPQSRPLKFSRS